MKKSIMVCMALLMVLILASCKAPGGNTQTVFIWGTVDAEIFKESTSFVPSKLREYVDDTVEKIKRAEVRLGLFFDAEYQKTTEKNGEVQHVYQVNAEGEAITLTYSGETQEMVQYSQTSKTVASLLNNIFTEEEFKDWICEFLVDLGQKDFLLGGLPYTYSCETKVITSGADFAGQRTVEGFYTAREDLQDVTEEVSAYIFNYTRFLGDVPTSDRVRVYISRNTIIIHLDEKRFSEMKAPELDMTACEEAVENFVNANLDTKKYTLASYEAKDAYLTYIGEKLCLVYAVELNLTNNISGGTIVTAQKVAVDVNAISK